MKNRRICLFTAHSPLVGGGGANFRSLISNLPELTIDWYYLANNKATGYERGYLGKGFMGDRIDKDVWQTGLMLSGMHLSSIDRIVQKLISIECDAYWIVSHNEGIRVALELSTVQNARPVHLTVNDDWSGSLCARSTRYRLFGSLADRMTRKVLKAVTSFDVTSRGMQTYYENISGRKGDISHRYITKDSLTSSASLPAQNSGRIKIGHIGSVYNKDVFFQFIDLMQLFSKESNVDFELCMWGWGGHINEIPNHLRNHVTSLANLPESQVIPQLAQCTFVYAMYPMDKRSNLFSRTSMPTKLSSYIQAGRPILGHGPADSSLAEFLHSTNTGVLWENIDKTDGLNAIVKLLRLEVDQCCWEFARGRYYGEANLATMRKVLL